MWKGILINWLSYSSDQYWPARATRESPTGKNSQQRPQLQVAGRQSCFSNIWATLTLTRFSTKVFSGFSFSKQVINPLRGYAILFQYPDSKAAVLTIFGSCRTVCCSQLCQLWVWFVSSNFQEGGCYSCTNERSNHVSLKAV